MDHKEGKNLLKNLSSADFLETNVLFKESEIEIATLLKVVKPIKKILLNNLLNEIK